MSRPRLTVSGRAPAEALARLLGPTGDGPSARAVVRVVVVLLAVGILLWLGWQTRRLLLWVAVAAFLATAIDPAVKVVQRHLRVRRAPAIGLVFVAFLGLLTAAAFVLVPPLIRAGQELAQEVPQYIDQLRDSDLVKRLDREYEVVDRLREGATDLLSGVAAPDTAVTAARRVVDGLFATISILVIAFLLSLYGARIRDWVVGAVRPEASTRLLRVSEGMYRVISGYVAGALLVAVTGAFAAAVFLTIVGVPYVPALAFWVGLMAMIPLVGSVLGAVPYVLVAFFSSSWRVGVAAVVFFVVYQQIENHLVQPQIMRRTVRLNPLWVIIAVIAGAQLLGIVGALVAVPVAGMLQVALQEWWRPQNDDPPPEPPEAPEPPPAASAVSAS